MLDQFEDEQIISAGVHVFGGLTGQRKDQERSRGELIAIFTKLLRLNLV